MPDAPISAQPARRPKAVVGALIGTAILLATASFGVRAQSAPLAVASSQPELPAIGKWLIASDGLPAHWLGELYRGKALREPINVILVDEFASSAEEAKARIVKAATLAGYPVRMGHSTGYRGDIGGTLYPQLPAGTDFAFSDAPFEIDNNHGRIFGPRRVGSSWVFTAAFSREDVDPLRTPGHRYQSFNQARDDFTQRMDTASIFKIAGFIPLGNAVVGNPGVTTGDHDGIAVLLKVPGR